MITVQCTSCKKALEIEEDSLASREPTSLKCPSCGVTLTVDKRKLQRSATGPVVKVAREGYRPVAPPPPGEELQTANETGEYAQMLAHLYTSAEEFLQKSTENKARAAVLRDADRRGQEAMRGLAVSSSPSTTDDANEADAHPELRSVDGKLITQSWYLHNTNDLAETASRLHPRLRAPHRYEPLVEWQKTTFTSLCHAYEAASARSSQLGSMVGHVRDAEKSYTDVCARHEADRHAFVKKIAAQEAVIANLDDVEIKNAERVLHEREASAGANGSKNLGAGGCVSAVVGVVLASVIGGAASSAAVGFGAFVVTMALGLFIAYQIGYAKNDSARSEAKQRLSELRGKRNDANVEKHLLSEALIAHANMAPGFVEATMRPDSWSLTRSDELDDRRESFVTAPVSLPGPRRVPIQAIPGMGQLQLNYVDLGVPKVMDLTHDLSVGRADGNDLILNHPSVSRNHAKFELRGEHWWVVELKSTNGVKVNGNLITEAQVAAGDRISVGSVIVDVGALPPGAFVSHPASMVLPERGGPEATMRASADSHQLAAMTRTMEVPATLAVPVASEGNAALKKRRNIIVGVVAGLALAIIAVLVWQMSFSLTARMQQALDRNNIYAPAGASLYDLYTKERATNPSSSVLAEFKPKIRDKIEPVAEDAFARWYKDSDDSLNWESLQRTYEFLAVMFPENAKYTARKLYAMAQQAINARDYAKAIASYEEALKLDPQWVLALNGLGKVYMIDNAPMKNDNTGMGYYVLACAADSKFTWAPKNLGDYYLRKDDYRRAESYLLLALATSPERPSILRSLGFICRKTNRATDAIAYYTKSMTFEKDPSKNASVQKTVDALRAHRSGD